MAKAVAKATKAAAPSVLLQSADSEWYTPRWLAELLKRAYGPFDLDPAAAPGTSLGARSYTRHDGGLEKPWHGRVFCNPPHARALGELVGPWMHKAIGELKAGRCELVVLLVPSNTDTTWWHDVVMPAAHEVRFIRGRLAFERRIASEHKATFPSVVVVLRKAKRRGPAPAFGTIVQPTRAQLAAMASKNGHRPAPAGARAVKRARPRPAKRAR